MTISRTANAWTESVTAEVASKKTLGYLRAQYKNRLHQLILFQFLIAESKGFSRTKMANKIGKRKEVITRLLSAPGNWTLDTVSDLMLALGGRPSTTFESFQTGRNTGKVLQGSKNRQSQAAKNR